MFEREMYLCMVRGNECMGSNWHGDEDTVLVVCRYCRSAMSFFSAHDGRRAKSTLPNTKREVKVVLTSLHSLTPHLLGVCVCLSLSLFPFVLDFK